MIATSTLTNATADDRMTMLRAMLAERLKLVVHVEQRLQEVYELLMARSDGRLGSGLTPIADDCAAKVAADRAAVEAATNAGLPPPRPPIPDFKAPPAPCSLRMLDPMIRDRSGDGQGRLGSLLEGETTIADLTTLLRLSTGRPVVDKTTLPGSYRVRMDFDMRFGRGPELAPAPDAPSSVFTAVREQLGLKLQLAEVLRDTIVIDRIDRPTEN